MRVLVIGAGGMIGQKLCRRLADDGQIGGQKIDEALLFDIIPPPPLDAPFPVTRDSGDVAAPYVTPKLAAARADLIFFLASVVSGEAEADFEKGYSINLEGGRGLFEAIRREHILSGGTYRPRVIFTSSIAVFGAPFPEKIGDDFLCAPLTSYGTQKAILELLLADYSRRGFFDGIGLRLPTICVRPGAPNKAASGFFSGIIREPLAGKEALLPVSEDVRHWHASPRSAIGFLVHAASLEAGALGARRTLNLPGVSATVGEQIEALRRFAGEKAVRLIRRVPDETIARIVAGWARDFEPTRAKALGFQADADFSAIIRAYMEDDAPKGDRLAATG
jgi:D-erythronate 2-dehydrogenase